jgi:hypothetical protein
MAHRALAGLCLAVLLAGCATVRNTVDRLQKASREPGEVMDADPDAVWQVEDCAAQPLPFFRLDRNEVKPSTLAAGESLNHRLIYTFCPETPEQVIEGALVTTVYDGTDTVFSDIVENFAIKPGRWIVDTEVIVPPEAEPGAYYLEVSFNESGAAFMGGRNVVVTAPAAP